MQDTPRRSSCPQWTPATKARLAAWSLCHQCVAPVWPRGSATGSRWLRGCRGCARFGRSRSSRCAQSPSRCVPRAPAHTSVRPGADHDCSGERLDRQHSRPDPGAPRPAPPALRADRVVRRLGLTAELAEPPRRCARRGMKAHRRSGTRPMECRLVRRRRRYRTGGRRSSRCGIRGTAAWRDG